MATGPLILLVMSVLFGMERLPERRIWLFMLGGFLGIVLILLPRHVNETADTSVMGILVVLGACLLWAIGSLLSRRHSSHPNRFMAASLHMLLASPVLLLISCLSGEWVGFEVSTLPWTTYAYFFYMVLGLCSYLSFIWLLGHTSSEVAASYAYISPVLALAISCFFMGERLSILGLFGCVLVLTMVALLMHRRARQYKTNISSVSCYFRKSDECREPL